MTNRIFFLLLLSAFYFSQAATQPSAKRKTISLNGGVEGVERGNRIIKKQRANFYTGLWHHTAGNTLRIANNKRPLHSGSYFKNGKRKGGEKHP